MSETPRTDFLDNTEIKSYLIWDLARELEKEKIKELENELRRMEQ